MAFYRVSNGGSQISISFLGTPVQFNLVGDWGSTFSHMGTSTLLQPEYYNGPAAIAKKDCYCQIINSNTSGTSLTYDVSFKKAGERVIYCPSGANGQFIIIVASDIDLR